MKKEISNKTQELLHVFYGHARTPHEAALYGFLLAACAHGRFETSTKDAALWLGMTKRQVLDARRRLELEGLIEVEHADGDARDAYYVTGYYNE